MSHSPSLKFIQPNVEYLFNIWTKLTEVEIVIAHKISPVKQVFGQLGMERKTQLLFELTPLLQVASNTDSALAASGIQFFTFLLANNLGSPLAALASMLHHLTELDRLAD